MNDSRIVLKNTEELHHLVKGELYTFIYPYFSIYGQYEFQFAFMPTETGNYIIKIDQINGRIQYNINLPERKKDSLSECTCNSLDLFRFGCKCGFLIKQRSNQCQN